MGPIGSPETSVTTSLYCVTSLKSEDLIYTAAEAWNHAADSSVLQSAQAGFQTHAIPYSVGTGGAWWGAGGVKVTTHPRVVPPLRMRGSIPPFLYMPSGRTNEHLLRTPYLEYLSPCQVSELDPRSYGLQWGLRDIKTRTQRTRVL
jgi:hypothetical protein